MYIAEVVSIGDELTSGQRLDTNSQWLSQQLGDLGVRTLFHTTIGDDLQSNIDAFRIAAKRADIVVCTGGLGPTADDLTRESFAQAFDRPLKLDQASLDYIQNLFAKRKRPMPQRNEVQAYFPEGCRVIPNPHGTAPGIDLEVEQEGHRCRFFSFPGVPAEMKQMWEQTVLDRLRTDLNLGNKKLFYHSLKLFGIGESDVEAKLPDLIHRDRYPRVGITVSQATITLRIAAEASDEGEFRTLIDDTRSAIHKTFGDLIFGEGELEIQEAVYQVLSDRDINLSIVEIGGDALAGRWLARCESESSNKQRLAGTIHFLDTARARNTLGTNASQNESSGNESPTTELAKLGQVFFASDWCLVVNRYPFVPGLASTSKLPMASIEIAVVGPDGENRLRAFELGAHPDVIMDRIAKTGLDQLRRELLGY